MTKFCKAQVEGRLKHIERCWPWGSQCCSPSGNPGLPSSTLQTPSWGQACLEGIDQKPRTGGSILTACGHINVKSFIEIWFIYFTIHLFKTYNSVVFSILSGASITITNFRTFHHPPKKNHPPQLHLYPNPTPSPTSPPNLLSVSVDLPVWTCHINGIIGYVKTCVRLLSFSIILSKFNHV